MAEWLAPGARIGSSWMFQQKLTADDGALGDNFGWSVTLDGDTALIGAYRDNTTAGNNAVSAYLYGLQPLLIISADAPDLSGDLLRYSATGLPPGLSLHGVSGILSGTVSLGAAGSYTVEVEVTDSHLADHARLHWTVLPQTQQPDRHSVYLPRIRAQTLR